MIAVVADAGVLVAELLRRRGRELFRHPELSVYVAEEQWEETRHELVRRLDVLVSRGQISDHRRSELEDVVQEQIDKDVITIVPASDYVHLRSMALRRVPRDERDWPTVALAIALNAGILTADNDFLGCGCPTWTVETLSAEVGAA
jgi:predicted nucleic acid-binding protein